MTLRNNSQKILEGSFFALSAALLVMVVIGGLTRLTGSGLSIVEWDPIMGLLPPLTLSEWEEAFSKYKLFPEFIKINSLFTLEDFKSIFWLEYIHRFWGRLLGLFLLPPTLFGWKFPKLRPLLVSLWGLGGLQGALGWWMVKSGLNQVPWVNPFRLTTHLLMALLLFSLSLWGAWRSSSLEAPVNRPSPPLYFVGTGSLIVLTILWGGLVAGNHAGLLFPTFPLMEGSFIPEGVWILTPWWKNLFWNPTGIQWTHRLLAGATFLSLLYGAFRSPALRGPLSIGVLQITLGALTVLQGVPLIPAVLHQGTAFCLWGAWLWAFLKYDSIPPCPVSERDLSCSERGS